MPASADFSFFPAASTEAAVSGFVCSASAARAIAQPTGCPRYVLVWSASPVDAGQASITSRRPTHADNGKPPVSALPRQIRSGTTPAWSQAKSAPVRLKPV